MMDILAWIVLGAVAVRWLARYEVRPVKPLTDDEKLEQRRREAVRKANAAFDNPTWWI
jgi:hypothetical protein